jgi:ferredoxin
MKLRVDITKCSGIGLCEISAPAVYEVGDEGHAQLVTDEPAAVELAAVEEAIASCPTGALSIEK